jgi:F0F1-type ATP synthase assembly protein I
MLMQQNQRQDNKAAYAKWAGLGIEFGGVVAVFCLIGYWLDQKFNTSPWFLLTGFFLAFIGMFYNIWKQTRNLRDK